ncbi:MAG: hypothetical protein KatS3mg016_2331 [Fimbriimonadales bacterium]|nr:MAG: hypothetical protein KatS3mg016_2331 [Fimbriimonadales bacterium]GIV07766.1 MAG: hypothetical protein KatS3mg017_0968 [Fimbriimonadales bacterium]
MRTYLILGALLTSVALSAAQVEPRGENPAIRVNTLFGSTGLITVPTSTTTRFDRFQLGVALGQNVRTVSLNWGVFESVEVGAVVVDLNNLDNKVIATGKVTITPQNFEWLELGFGTIDPFDAIDKTFYGIASVNVRVPAQAPEQVVGLRLHLGYGTGIYRDKVIGGGEVFLNNQFSVVGEYNGVDSNFALRYVYDNNLRLQLGIQAKVIYFSTTYGLSF